MNYFLALNPFFKCLFNDKILSVRILLMHPVYTHIYRHSLYVCNCVCSIMCGKCLRCLVTSSQLLYWSFDGWMNIANCVLYSYIEVSPFSNTLFFFMHYIWKSCITFSISKCLIKEAFFYWWGCSNLYCNWKWKWKGKSNFAIFTTSQREIKQLNG